MGEASKWSHCLDGISLTEHKPATEAREASTTHVYGMNRSADWKQEKAAKGCGPARLPVPTQWAWPHQGGRSREEGLSKLALQGPSFPPRLQQDVLSPVETIWKLESLFSGSEVSSLLCVQMYKPFLQSNRPWGLGTIPQQEGAFYSGDKQDQKFKRASQRLA